MSGKKTNITLVSMTGYGRGNQSIGDRELAIEIKTVNHKGLEIVVRSPVDFVSLENQIIKYAGQYLRRGRVEIYIGFNSPMSQPETRIELDEAVAKQYYRFVQGLAAQLHVPLEITIGQLLALPGILKTQGNGSPVAVSWEMIQPALENALQSLLAMRKTEGEELQKDIVARINAVGQNVKKIHKFIPQAIKSRQAKLKENIKALFERNEFKLDSNQVAAAAITLLDQCDVTEELVRVDSHLAQFHETVNSDDAAGRRLDFILQELFREFTTIGSKTNDADIGRLVVDIKTDLDKIKQQVANIE